NLEGRCHLGLVARAAVDLGGLRLLDRLGASHIGQRCWQMTGRTFGRRRGWGPRGDIFHRWAGRDRGARSRPGWHVRGMLPLEAFGISLRKSKAATTSKKER